MKHRANPRFWRCDHALPENVRDLADQSYALLKSNPSHRSLHFKKVRSFWSSRVGRHYRALAIEAGDDLDRGSDSGTAGFVRSGVSPEAVTLRSAGSYVACVSLPLSGSPTLFVSVHVGPPDYKKHLRTLADELDRFIAGRRFVVGGDLNTARHWDEVDGGRWCTEFFEDLAKRGFYDCHWARHGREVQSFWGHQAREAYQCDHIFTDQLTAVRVTDCAIVDNEYVRKFSDHGPLHLGLDGESFGRAG